MMFDGQRDVNGKERRMLDRRGRRSPETLSAIRQRDRLLREAADRFCRGMSDRQAAQHLRAELLKASTGKWRRGRVGRTEALLWMILKLRDFVPGETTIRRAIRLRRQRFDRPIVVRQVCELGHLGIKRAGSDRRGAREKNIPRSDGAVWPEYRAWLTMQARCLNPHDKGFKNYGQRGVGVCDRWLSFDNFIADMGRRPSRYHSIDRIENDGNYSPRNCRWATWSQQMRNTRRQDYSLDPLSGL
jgi:hypothetical protein